MADLAGRIAASFDRLGVSVTWKYMSSGDICGCIAGGGTGGYSADWHDANPTEPNCGGLEYTSVVWAQATDRVALLFPGIADSWSWATHLPAQVLEGLEQPNSAVVVGRASGAMSNLTWKTDHLYLGAVAAGVRKFRMLHEPQDAVGFGLSSLYKMAAIQEVGPDA